MRQVEGGSGHAARAVDVRSPLHEGKSLIDLFTLFTLFFFFSWRWRWPYRQRRGRVRSHVKRNRPPILKVSGIYIYTMLFVLLQYSIRVSALGTVGVGRGTHADDKRHQKTSRRNPLFWLEPPLCCHAYY